MWIRFHKLSDRVPMSVPRKVTIRDVAALAGCGIATASRVLNNSGPASDDVRRRVEAAAQELDFSFNGVGRALRSRKSRTIGCLVPSLANPVFADAVQGVQQELQAGGYQLLLTCSNYDAGEDERAIRMLMEKQVEGLVLTVTDAVKVPALQQLRRSNLPCWLMFNPPSQDFASAYIDNRAAAARVARAFADAGHRKAAFLALRLGSSDRSRQRLQGFFEGCADCGMAVPAVMEIDEAAVDLPQRLGQLLAAQPDITGLFASNDFLALAAIRAARLVGRSVPENLSVVGFDGIAIGRMFDPPLATIETSPEILGRNAARGVLAALAGAEAPQSEALPFHFRPGGSLATIG
jgi:DNA-binding LacI/PurR family transcriptional regulator